MYNCISLITLHVTNNLLAQRRPSMLSERAVYTELELSYRLKQIFISAECGLRSKLFSIPKLIPLHFVISFQSKKHGNCVLPHRHPIIWYG